MADDPHDGQRTRIDHAVAAWLRSATVDLAAARILADRRDDDIDPFIVAFHAQQAAEKAAKALLIWLGRSFPPTHDLTQLVESERARQPGLATAALRLCGPGQRRGL